MNSLSLIVVFLIFVDKGTCSAFLCPVSPMTKNVKFTESISFAPCKVSATNNHICTRVNGSNDDIESDPTGRKRGLILFPVILFIATWLFSIPPEFRRARICTEQQVIDNPSSKCITAKNWVIGIQDYYRNGGGVDFDFSVDQDS